MMFGKYIRPAMVLVDWAFVNIFFGISVLIWPDRMFVPQWQLWVLVNISFIPVIVRERNYDRTSLRAIHIDRIILHELGSLTVTALVFMALVTLLSIPSPGIRFYGTYYGMLGAALIAWAIFMSRVLKYYRRRGFNFLRAVIVGVNPTASRLYEAMSHDSSFGYKVLAFFSGSRGEELEGKPVLPIDELEAFVDANKVDQIYFTLPGNDATLTRAVKIADEKMVEFYYVPQISRYVPAGLQIGHISNVPVLALRSNPLKSTFNRMLKRSFDLGFSMLFLIFYPLLYIPIAIGIKLSSPGPVYFRQQRTGYLGKSFDCLKFRTMRVNVDADRLQATADDPRKTRFGDLLRRTNLDELPQFINVLRGEMSIVGPRPHMLRHTEEYSQIVSQYMVRHVVKPGITGWAQINGYRGITDELWKMEKRVEHDVWYIEHWTPMLDLKIIARTFVNLFQKDSNAF